MEINTQVLSQYVHFTERNNWERETWHRFIPASSQELGNLKAVVEKLKCIQDKGSPYSLEVDCDGYLRLYTQEEVEAVCKKSNKNNYLDYYGVAEIKPLTPICPKEVNPEYFFSDQLYKLRWVQPISTED